MEHERDPGSPLRCFGAAVLADSFFIVGRVPRLDFRLADLADISLGLVSEVPTPWWMLAYDLAQAGLDPGAIKLVDGPGRPVAGTIRDGVGVDRRGSRLGCGIVARRDRLLIWPATPAITVEAFERLRAAMLHAGAITRQTIFADSVFVGP